MLPPLGAFGPLLKKLRKEARRRAGGNAADFNRPRVARLLGISAKRLSLIEAGSRDPLSPQQIMDAAKLLRTDPGPLLAAAACDEALHKGFVSIRTRGRNMAAFNFILQIASMRTLSSDLASRLLTTLRRYQRTALRPECGRELSQGRSRNQEVDHPGNKP
jgi:transcriptional regulator with XRE-family HTH domain